MRDRLPRNPGHRTDHHPHPGTVTAGAITSGAGNSTSSASATLTVAPPATVSISKALSASPTGTPTNGTGIPQTGFPVTLTCTHSKSSTGTPFSLSMGTASATTQLVQANDTCTFTEGTPPSLTSTGYSWGSITYTPTSASVTTSAGATMTAQVTNTLIAGNNTVTLAGALNPGTVGGTAPTPALTCVPSATGSGTSYTVTTGASCTLSVGTAGTAPGGYTLGTTSYGTSTSGLTINASTGIFTVPNGGGSVTATTQLNLNAAQTLCEGSLRCGSRRRHTGAGCAAWAYACA